MEAVSDPSSRLESFVRDSPSLLICLPYALKGLVG
ncbi:hypothetical protein LINPERPRIM_LOCUS23756 [Linum perenne]